MGKSLKPDKKVGNLQFYKFPYLDILIAIEPDAAIADLSEILNNMVIDEQTAAVVLQRLIDTGRKTGLQLSVIVEYPESALPEVHRLTHAVFSLDKFDGVYRTPKSGNAYTRNSLFQLFGR